MADLYAGWEHPDDEFHIGVEVGKRIWYTTEARQLRPPDAPDAPDVPLPVWISLAKRDGRLYCDALILGDLRPHRFTQHREITAARLREISIPQLVSWATHAASLDGPHGDMVRELVRELPTVRPPVRGARGYPDEHFREVAALYRRALLEHPSRPTAWLAEQYVTSLPTARRWIQRARDRGYLGASTPGRAGETTETGEDPN